MLFGAFVLDVAPMVGGEIGIAAAVGFETGLVILQADDEGQDRRLVGRQLCFAQVNGRAP
ncbi:MAG: hypothetical protein U1E93_10105 [Alphaproteobacteria bacterium]